MLDGYRLVYPDSPPVREILWEWEGPYIRALFKNAGIFHRQVEQRSFLDWDALAQENQRIWTTYYLPRPLYQPWETWRAWLDEYREIVCDVQDMAGEHNGRRREDRLRARQNGQRG